RHTAQPEAARGDAGHACRRRVHRPRADHRRKRSAICPCCCRIAAGEGGLMRIAVVGNGMVGQRFLEQLVRHAKDKGTACEITVFCEEPRPAYDRVQLTSFFSGKSARDLNVVPEKFFEEHGLTLRLNDAVLGIDPVAKVVRSARYKNIPYDKLVFATGSNPFVPQVSGRDRRDCFVYRTIEDLETIAARAARARIGAVIGGGLLGLEAAKALKDLGLETHIVEFAPRLMSVQLDDSAG